MTQDFLLSLTAIPKPFLNSTGKRYSIASTLIAAGYIPHFLVNASAGVDIYKSERVNMRIQADGQNLTNVLDVIDFGGLFSGQRHRSISQFCPSLDDRILVRVSNADPIGARTPF